MSDKFGWPDGRKDSSMELLIDLAIIVHSVGKTDIAARLLKRRGVPFDTAIRVLFDVSTRRQTEIISQWRIFK